MISTRTLVKLARKYQNFATAASRKRISLSRTNSTTSDEGFSCSSSSSLADKGHFAFYTSDQRRFMIPLPFLKTEIFIELLKMAEQEFGVSGDGPIKLPCDSVLVEYAITILRRHADKELQKALLLSLTGRRCSVSNLYSNQEQSYQQLPISSF